MNKVRYFIYVYILFDIFPSLLSPNGGLYIYIYIYIYTDCTRLKNTVAVALFSWNMHFFREIFTDFHEICTFSRKKKPLREAAQRIRDFYPEKKNPAGGRTTDKGFFFYKNHTQAEQKEKKKKQLWEAAQRIRDFFIKKKSPCGRPHNG